MKTISMACGVLMLLVATNAHSEPDYAKRLGEAVDQGWKDFIAEVSAEEDDPKPVIVQHFQSGGVNVNGANYGVINQQTGSNVTVVDMSPDRQALQRAERKHARAVAEIRRLRAASPTPATKGQLDALYREQARHRREIDRLHTKMADTRKRLGRTQSDVADMADMARGR